MRGGRYRCRRLVLLDTLLVPRWASPLHKRLYRRTPARPVQAPVSRTIKHSGDRSLSNSIFWVGVVHCDVRSAPDIDSRNIGFRHTSGRIDIKSFYTPLTRKLNRVSNSVRPVLRPTLRSRR
jgi:hypothetical protein